MVTRGEIPSARTTTRKNHSESCPATVEQLAQLGIPITAYLSDTTVRWMDSFPSQSTRHKYGSAGSSSDGGRGNCYDKRRVSMYTT